MKSLKRPLTVALILVLVVAAVVVFAQFRKEAPPVTPQKPKPNPVEPEPVRYYWPLTGLEAKDETVTLKRPISVKVENSPAARPQTGLNSADIVYETMVEGGITRFNAIFQSQLPEDIGPVRSARLSDIWIVPQYDALFYYSGSNRQVAGRINDRGFQKFNENNAGKQFHRISSRRSPHNLYFDTSEIKNAVKREDFRRKVKEAPRRLEFGELGSLETTLTGAYVSVGISSFSQPNWTFDADDRVYLRAEKDTPLKDADGDSQIRATNVVVMWATYTRQTNVDKAGSNTFDTDLGGQGKAYVFKDGMVYKGTWEADKNSPPRFKDKEGKAILLNPGNSWFEIIPSDRDVKIKKQTPDA